MADRDNSPQGFLERWSRKKIEGERDDPPTEPQPANATPESPGSPGRVASKDASTPAEAAAKPEFDLASLPSLDSITAVTDVRAFLAPGVPRELARAALRRAWTADPAIRDFKGLAENDWDFNDPTAMPGFGALPEGYDVRKLVAQIFGDDAKPVAPEAASEQPPVPQLWRIADENASPAPPEEAAPVSTDAMAPPRISGSDRQMAEAEIVQRNDDIASQQSISGDETEEPKMRRQHGGALPQ
jgi:hypothetical protein